MAITNTFGEFLAAHGLKQARIAETEKYAHVTFFFNGGVEELNEGEDRILVKSPKVATYDLKPEMSAPEVYEKLVGAIKFQKYDVIIINFANPDMVGHTGVQKAAIQAIEVVDGCVGKAVDAIKEVNVAPSALLAVTQSERRWDRRTLHRSYHQPGSLHPGKRRSLLYLKRGRLPGRHRTDPDRTHGNGRPKADRRF